MAVEVVDLPNDGTIDGGELFVVVDTADNDLGKSITMSALRDYIVGQVPATTLADLSITADATELNQLDGVTLGDIVTRNASEFATSAQGLLADSALQQSDVSVTGQTLSIGTLDYTPAIPSNSDITTLVGNTVNKTFVDNLNIDAATVGGNQVLTPVPLNAVFTDTNTQLSNADVQAIIDINYLNSQEIDAGTVDGFSVGVNVPANAVFNGTPVEANPGGTGDPLTTVRIDGDIYMLATGAGGQLVTSNVASTTSLAGAGGTVTFTVTGTANTVVNFTVINADPAGFITTADLTQQQITLNASGTGGTSITVPALSAGSRSFQIQALAVGDGQLAALSQVVNQSVVLYSASLHSNNFPECYDYI